MTPSTNDPKAEPRHSRGAAVEAQPLPMATVAIPTSHVQWGAGERRTSGISSRRSREDVEVVPAETATRSRGTSGISSRRGQSVDVTPTKMAQRSEDSRAKG